MKAARKRTAGARPGIGCSEYDTKSIKARRVVSPETEPLAQLSFIMIFGLGRQLTCWLIRRANKSSANRH